MQVSAVTVVGGTVLGAARAESAENGWLEVESPTTKTLHGAVETVEGPFAVGAGGTIVERTNDGSSGGSGGTNNTSVGTNETTNASSLSTPDTDKTVKRYREGVVEFE